MPTIFIRQMYWTFYYLLGAHILSHSKLEHIIHCSVFTELKTINIMHFIFRFIGNNARICFNKMWIFGFKTNLTLDTQCLNVWWCCKFQFHSMIVIILHSHSSIWMQYLTFSITRWYLQFLHTQPFHWNFISILICIDWTVSKKCFAMHWTWNIHFFVNRTMNCRNLWPLLKMLNIKLPFMWLHCNMWMKIMLLHIHVLYNNHFLFK